jgi:hypothetical protein
MPSACVPTKSSIKRTAPGRREQRSFRVTSNVSPVSTKTTGLHVAAPYRPRFQTSGQPLNREVELNLGLDSHLFQRQTRGQKVEGLAGLDENRWVTRRGLVTSDDHIDIERVEFDAAANTPGLVGGDQGRA